MTTVTQKLRGANSLPRLKDSLDFSLKVLSVQPPSLQSTVDGGGLLELHDLLGELEQLDVSGRNQSGQSPPLIDALDASSFDQFLNCAETLLVWIAQGQEPT